MSFKIGDRVIITKYWTGQVGTIVYITGNIYQVETDAVHLGNGNFLLGEFIHLTPLVKALL